MLASVRPPQARVGENAARQVFQEGAHLGHGCCAWSSAAVAHKARDSSFSGLRLGQVRFWAPSNNRRKLNRRTSCWPVSTQCGEVLFSVRCAHTCWWCRRRGLRSLSRAYAVNHTPYTKHVKHASPSNARQCVCRVSLPGTLFLAECHSTSSVCSQILEILSPEARLGILTVAGRKRARKKEGSKPRTPQLPSTKP